MEKVIFAAGCFWGVQYYFDQVPGVIKSTVGYTGGNSENPTYEDVCYRNTGHAEAVQLEFDPKIINFETLVKQFFRMHDPTQLNRQGPDVGDQYRSAIFYTNEDQKQIAKAVKKSIQSSLKRGIVTEIVPIPMFYPAEEYHQKYTKKTGRGICHVSYQAI